MESDYAIQRGSFSVDEPRHDASAHAPRSEKQEGDVRGMTSCRAVARTCPRKEWQMMLSKKPCVVVLAACVLALNVMLLPRVGSAAGNDDLELVQRPGMRSGEPDIPGRGLTTAAIWTLGLILMP